MGGFYLTIIYWEPSMCNNAYHGNKYSYHISAFLEYYKLKGKQEQKINTMKLNIYMSLRFQNYCNMY